MPAKATITISAASGPEKVEDKYEFEADSAVAVTEQLVCAQGDGFVDLYAGPKKNIRFLLIKSDPYQPPGACTGSPKEYVKIGFTKDGLVPGDLEELKHFLLSIPTTENDADMPVDQVYVKNDLTVDIKISVLAIRKTPVTTADAKKVGQPANIG